MKPTRQRVKRKKIELIGSKDDFLKSLEGYIKLNAIIKVSPERVANAVFEAWVGTLNGDITIIEPIFNTFRKYTNRGARHFYKLARAHLKHTRKYEKHKDKLEKVEKIFNRD